MSETTNLTETVTKFLDIVKNIQEKTDYALSAPEAADVIFKILDRRGSIEDELDELEDLKKPCSCECDHECGCDCEDEGDKEDDEEKELFEEDEEDEFEYVDKPVDKQGRLYLSENDVKPIALNGFCPSTVAYAFTDKDHPTKVAFIAANEGVFKTKKFKKYLKENFFGTVKLEDLAFRTLKSLGKGYFSFKATPFNPNTEVFMVFDEDNGFLSFEESID